MLTEVQEWFVRRSYHYRQFGNLAHLVDCKNARGLTVSLVLPTREVRETIGIILDKVGRLNDQDPLLDQILVIDADSADGTADIARAHGAEVYSENELLAEFGPARGKGDAIWRSLSVTHGDIVIFADADTIDFESHFVYGVLGPLLSDAGVRYAKGAFQRPFVDGETVRAEGGGRVTELTARPLLNFFYPQLAGFAQPLAGEFAADRQLLRSIPFFCGYGVEIGLLIDVLRSAGLDAIAQVDLATRQNRHQSLSQLSRMSYAVLRAVAHRLHQEHRLSSCGEAFPTAPLNTNSFLQIQTTAAGMSLQEHLEALVERPPMRTVMRDVKPRGLHYPTG